MISGTFVHAVYDNCCIPYDSIHCYSSIFNIANKFLNLLLRGFLGICVHAILLQELQEILLIKVGAIILYFEVDVLVAELEEPNRRVLVDALLLHQFQVVFSIDCVNIDVNSFEAAGLRQALPLLGH